MMSSSTASPSPENDTERLRGILEEDALSIGLVSAFSGDRPLTADEDARLKSLQERRKTKFFSDLLYAITHQFFPTDVAEKLWNEILQHKYEMSKTLCRNVQITVATLDYLSNLKGSILQPTLISEAHIAEIVGRSTHDGLTGLLNHSSFFEILELDLRKSVRYGTATSLIIADVDDFKQVNDRHGHQVGDAILIALADMLRHETRDADICCRYGGEELAVILPFTDLDEAALLADRIRLAAMRIDCHGTAVTISLGVAAYGLDASSAFALVEKADRALYRAKRNGKNRVEMEASLGAPPSAGWPEA